MGAYNRRNTRARRQVWSYFGPVHWGGAGEGGEDMLHTRRMMFAGTVSAIALGMAAPAYAQDTTGAATANQGEAPNEIVVTGIRASLEAALDAKRNANAIVDSVSAEDVGKFPNTNVAEALTLVPGVTVDRQFGQGEKVSILGTDPALNRTLLDGQTVASADWFILDSPGRTFNYALLAPQLVNRVDVYKSPEARIDEGSIGGTVNVVHRKPTDTEPIPGPASFGYLSNDRPKKGQPQGTDPALNRTLLDGQTVASADWFILDSPGRTFNYALLAPQLVNRVDVYKSPEARIDEGSIGGTVNVVTRKPLDLEPFTGAASFGYLYNDRSKKGDLQGSALLS